MLAKDLFSRQVIDEGGNRVGKIADLDVDIMSGVVHYIVIRTGLLSSRKIKLDKIKSVGDEIILNVRKNTLQDL
ncbi:MAG TPA: PRC-barrel domain-containing protein [Dehalococcoidia bacterium]|nr:PRC-barrel domain-containing protein [Dehalococcoidia bacterium]